MGLVLEGQSCFYYQQANHTIGPEDLVVVNPNEVHSCNPTPGQNWSYHMLYFSPCWIAQLQQSLFGGDGCYQPISAGLVRRPRLNEGLKNLVDILFNEPDKLACFDAVYDFTILLLQQGGTSEKIETKSNINAAIEYLNQHITQQLSLEQLADKVHLSPYHFLRQFKAVTGLPPHAYQIDRRIELAKNMLKSGFPIAHVAQQTGFADQAHFQRHFKARVAATPKVYQAGI